MLKVCCGPVLRHPVGLLFKRQTLDRPPRSVQVGIDRLVPVLGAISVPSDEPCLVVVTGELDERGSQLFDGIEVPYPQQVR